MNNCIFDDNTDGTIGFYKDMKNGLEEQGCEFIKSGDYEQARDICEMLTELEEYREYSGLLLLSENNGMGWTITKYKEEK